MTPRHSYFSRFSRGTAMGAVAALIAFFGGFGVTTLQPAPASAVTLCGALGVTIMGTPGNDVINGTAGRDVIAGLGGNDTINGLGGDDVICAGDGNDTIDGGDGNDQFFADAGDDTIQGGTGFNEISYGSAPNGVQVNLQTGTATGFGNDRLLNIRDLFGSPFNDILLGSDAPNEIFGAGGSDIIAGGAGSDFLSALGNSGKSILIGGTGNDELAGDGPNAVADYLDCTGLQIDLGAGTATCGGQGTDSLDSVDDVLGSQFDDTIIGNDQPNRIFGEGGNDVIRGAGGDDLIDAGDGNDNVDGGNGNDTGSFASSAMPVTVDLAAGTATGQGNDTVHNVENLVGSTASGNTLLGDNNVNHITGVAGDLIEGRGGNDVFTAPSRQRVTLSYASAPGGVTVNVDKGTATGAAGNDTFNFIPATLIGSAFADTLACSTSPSLPGCTVDGRGGNDTITGSGSNDRLRGGNGNDRIVGGGGVDIADYTTGNAVNVNLATGTATGQGNDTLSGIRDVDGSPHNDTIVGTNLCTVFGNAGDDHLSSAGSNCGFSGGDGNDTITGTPGTDVIDPGSGNDTVNAGAGDDFVGGDVGDDHLDGGTGNDTLVYSSAFTPLHADLTKGTVTGNGNDTTTGFENFNGGFGDDTVLGTAGVNFIHGGGGDDVIHGGGGNDGLFGDDGNDTITGDAGNDTIDGGDGNDVLRGGSGTDTVSYFSASGGVTVDLLNGLGFATGVDTLSGFENITGSRFDDTLTGNAGPNVIDGGLGNDVCDGGGGTDTLRNCP